MSVTHPSRRRLRAPLIHATASLLVALAVSAIIFLVWFPGAYATIAGGLNLFFIIVAVDVVSGPLLTAVVADPKRAARVPSGATCSSSRSCSSPPSRTAST